MTLWAIQPRLRCFLAEAVFKVLRRQVGFDEGWCRRLKGWLKVGTNIVPAGLTVLVTL
jgi:hypothetical protein